ncbi:MAG: hypothetical protein K6T80_02000 [Firmicutes bacterium]|nr:hypothetical protein [Bacillota bacterium]
MNRFLPFLVLLAGFPDADKKLEALNNLFMATRESVMNIKTGIDTFHAAMTPFMARRKENGSKSDWS